MDTAELVRQGYLSKPGRLTGQLVSRYYKLYADGRLVYWTGKPPAAADTPPKGEMRLDATWHVAPAGGADPCAFRVNEAGRTHELVAESADEQRSWVDDLCELITAASGTRREMDAIRAEAREMRRAAHALGIAGHLAAVPLPSSTPDAHGAEEAADVLRSAPVGARWAGGWRSAWGSSMTARCAGAHSSRCAARV